MNLLLLLSALLSALTGVGASTRVPERAQAVAVVGVERGGVRARSPLHASSRPAVALPALVAVATFHFLAPLAGVRAVPRWIDRRRE